MADIHNPSSQKLSLPKIHGSLPKLPGISKLPKIGGLKPLGAPVDEEPKKPAIPQAVNEPQSGFESAPSAPSLQEEHLPEMQNPGVSGSGISQENLAQVSSVPEAGSSADTFSAGVSMPSSPKLPQAIEHAVPGAVPVAVPAAVPVAVPGAVPVAVPAAVPAAAPVAETPALHDAPVSAPSDGSIVPGSSDDEDLKWEDEAPDDLGEKTVMLDASDDEEELGIDNEKTQISMSSMDYDPLSGKLIVESGKTNQREYILVRETTSIGRSKDNDIEISDIAMSRHHAQIEKMPAGFRLRDNDSGNGTLLNGYRIRSGQLRSGDIIEIGGIRFRFEQSGGDPDELWKGEAKVEYHPNQPKKKSAPVSNYPSPQNLGSNGGMPTGNPAVPPAPQSQPQPQMESMLERQGGGLAAPAWAPQQSLTSPYMMTYAANKDSIPPMWSTAVLIGLLAAMMGAVVFIIAAKVSVDDLKENLENRNKNVTELTKLVASASDDYGNALFDKARKDLSNIEEIDNAYSTATNEHLLTNEHKTFIDSFRLHITREEQISREIKELEGPYGTMKIDEFERNMKVLRAVPIDSINKRTADLTLGRMSASYAKALEKACNEAVRESRITEAHEYFDKLSELPGQTASHLSALSKMISDKEKVIAGSK